MWREPAPSGPSGHGSRASLLALRLAGAPARRGPLCSLHKCQLHTHSPAPRAKPWVSGRGMQEGAGAGRPVRGGYTAWDKPQGLGSVILGEEQGPEGSYQG